MASVPVSEFIWGQLEQEIEKAVRFLIKDIATTLGQSPDPLRNALKGKIKIHLVEDLAESITQKCNYLCTHPDSPAILSPCGEAIVWMQVPTQRCPAHMGKAALPSPSLILTPLHGGYGYAADGTVYNGKGEACGFYADGTLTLMETV